jgi:eukaryotic-like serine/threonine-protein kinase
MAIVYLARDIRHKRPVALKVLHPELGAVLGTERFLREVETAAGLQHPHILPVFDSGETAGRLWYTMPYVEGESLRDRLKREVQLPVEDAVRLTREVAEALDYAHRHGVVHRDIKPDNILLTEGHASVADFGIAKAVSSAGGETLTQTGTAVGTPAYMSPEQASPGAPLDGRSDIYSLGCVLYEMLAGEPPFTGPSSQAIIARHCADPPRSMRVVRPGVPLALERAVERALAKVPADRFQTAGEFARSLALPEVSPPAASAPPAAYGPEATSAAPLKPKPRRRMPAGLAALAIGVLLGLGLLLAWFRTRPEAGAGGPKRLAVLPFENLGRPEDGYFADGVTDEVRGKLATLPGLEVIARASSIQYKETTKSPQQIGRELGVNYLLTGTVRWDKDTSGPSRVRVSPELVQVSTASTKWQAPFEAPLTDVFGMQADVASRVAEALGLAIDAGERERLAERPTENLAAYDAFLKGEEATGGLAIDLAVYRRAIDYYERAVALDSTFALAWARLSRALSYTYWAAPTTAGAAAARQAVERALALAPKLPEGYYALAYYTYTVHDDLIRAYEHSQRAWQLAPKDARFLALVAQNELALGYSEEGLKHLQDAQALDPRSVETATAMVWALVGLRRYPEALQAAKRGLAVAPTDLGLIHAAKDVYLAQGDLTGAQAVLRAVPRDVDPATLVAHIATWGDFYWVLDDAQQRLLLRLSPGQFGDDRATWGFALAQTHALRGDSALARAYADSARLVLEARLRDVPQDPETHTYLGLALAYMGRRADAIREGERGLALVPTGKSPDARGAAQHNLARIYVLVGEPEKALDLLEPLVETHYDSPGGLKIDPAFAPLRGNPRFERLIVGK